MPPIITKSSVQTLLDLVAEGEGLHIEFKRLIHSAPKIARSISALANTAGGTILVGVDDDRRIVGIQSEKEMLHFIDEALRYHIEPTPQLNVRFVEFKRRLVLLIDIPESPERPHFHIESLLHRDTGKTSTERRIFLREGSHNKAAGEDRIALMLSAKEPIRMSFTNRERQLLDYLDTHELITAEQFAENACIPTREARRILVSLVQSGALRLVNDAAQGAFTLSTC